MTRLSTHIAHSIIAAIADRHFDVYIRTTLLEGIAGVRPGLWASRGTIGLELAVAELGLPPDSLWASPRDTGTYGNVFRYARSTLARSKREDRAEEVLSDVMSGVSLGGRPGGVLYQIGALLKENGKWDKKDRSLGDATRLLIRHVGQRVLNTIRGLKREESNFGLRTPVQDRPAKSNEMNWEIDQLPGTTMFSPDAADVTFQRFLGGPWADQARTWLMDVWEQELRPSEIGIVRAWLMDPDKPALQLGKELGVSNSFIGKTIKRAISIAQDAFTRTPPDFVRDMDLNEELSGLGINVRRATNIRGYFDRFFKFMQKTIEST